MKSLHIRSSELGGAFRGDTRKFTNVLPLRNNYKHNTKCKRTKRDKRYCSASEQQQGTTRQDIIRQNTLT